MINLKEYARFWQTVSERHPQIRSVCFVTLEANIADQVLRIKADQTPTLFFLAPSAELKGSVDNMLADNRCAVMVLKKYNSSTTTAAQTLIETQSAINIVVDELADLGRCVCSGLTPQISSITILPETEMFAGWAGWSLLFTIETD